jgi:transcriptional regulator with XRE-family HTH domain
MNAYQTALKHFLGREGVRQDDIAAKIGKSQPALNRYANGHRFPDAETARLIETATNGIVSFKLWQSVALDRLGIGADQPQSDEPTAAAA